MMTPPQYINNINQRYLLGNATEHTFRGDLQQLLENLVPNIQATNEPKRQLCGAPDYILTRKDIPLGYIEAKDIGDKDLEGEKKTGNKEQFDRYRASLNNLIFTDYLRFHFYRNGECVAKIAIAQLTDKGIMPLPENFEAFEKLIKDFCSHVDQTIKNSQQLAAMMAGKARLLADVIEKALNSDENQHEDSTLKDQMTAFQQILIHDITPKGFADVYAQTITYGMFAARYHDPTLPTFSRQEAAELIPKSNPFLRKLFGYIAGPDIDDRIKWIVDNLVEIFLACNVQEMLEGYGKATQMEDPIIHFYEDFLSEYDPKLRKTRGVWYTPQPVVGFIVRAVDELLKTEFDLPQGLADNSKTKITVAVQGKKVEQEVHKVQILDPATGTGTFLAETIKHIHKKFKGQQGIWSNYVEMHLLPRLNGFELLMASYAMAHLKLDLLLSETAYKPTKNQRFRVFLTNSLEESHPDASSLFANWLSQEANEANYIKRDTPVMCVIGNPPYSGESANKGEWIMNLMEDYKKEPGGKEKLNERNPKWINDDYVKFLRYGQHFIEKNGSGILAYINPHGYLDNPTFRGMRWHLLKTYDKIYTIDLHGNSKKKETAPDGSIDQNVFDIMQGVSINIFVKTGKKKNNELGKVFHFELYGKRESKYKFLTENSIKTVAFKELPNLAPNYFFVNKDFDLKDEYDKGFAVNELFPLNNVGIVTARDSILIGDTVKILVNNVENYYKISMDKSLIKKINYRPFDSRFVYFDTKLVERSREKVMQHFLKGENVGLVTIRRSRSTEGWREIFVSSVIISGATTISSLDINYLFPLYLYPETNSQGILGEDVVGRVPNLNMAIVNKIAACLGLPFAPEKKAPLLRKEGQGVVEEQNINSFLHPKIQGVVEEQNINSFLHPKIQGVVEEQNINSFLHPKIQGVVEEQNINSFLHPKIQGVVEEQNINSFLHPKIQGVVEEQNINSFPHPKIQGVVEEHPITQTGVVEKHRINNLPHLKTFRKELRNNLTPAEAKFWTLVQNSKLEGRKFRRQHSVGNYILDFYCPSEKLAIELDGEVHFNESAQLKDKERTLFLNYFGIKVLRFENKLVFEQTERVLEEVKNSFGWSKTTPDPSLEGGELLERSLQGGELLERSLQGGELLERSLQGGELLERSLQGGEFLEFAPIDILDYIYAVLHSPSYREQYKEFLKIDFPRVPYPKDGATFWALVKLGGVLRALHLLESPTVEDYITEYPENGDNTVGKIKYQDGKVYINDTQYFGGVPQVAWEFYIGGYQPAQKWLKDRKDCSLAFEDILHYQKIIVALTETARLIQEIDQIESI